MEYRSCGFLVFRSQPVKSFLLMKHAERWDLPKGHVDPGETDLQCATREFEEETGLSAQRLVIDEGFHYESHYEVRYRSDQGRSVPKTLVIFLATLHGDDADIQVTEHQGYEWFDWTDPPPKIQPMAIDPLLDAVAGHFRKSSSA